MNHDQIDQASQVRRQKMMIALILLLAVGFMFVRMRLHIGFNQAEFDQLYGALCVQIKEGGDGQALYRKAKKELRHAGTKSDVLFFFQFVGIYAGKIQPPPRLQETDPAIREAVLAGQFDHALQLTRDALVDSDEMTAARAKAWGKLIRELRVRWNHNCTKPADPAHAERSATQGNSTR